MKKLQINGLPVNGVFDEISTSDFAESGETFVFKPQDNEIYELTGVKMFFDNKLVYKPIKVTFYAFDGSIVVVEYNKLKDWLAKSNEGVTVDSDSFEGKKIVCYTRTFTESVYLVASNLLPFLQSGSIKVPAIEKIEVSVSDGEKIVDSNGEDVEIVQGRYDVVKYTATDEDVSEWLS